MAIRTTAHLHLSTLALIDSARKKTRQRRNDIIIALLTRAMTDPRMETVLGRAIRYQDRDRKECWRTIHVRFSEDEADYFSDLRNFFKLSISLIIAIAARRYLSEMLNATGSQSRVDNYPFQNYVLSRETIDGLTYWKICWGFPRDPQNHFPTPP
ncbi:MAG TPA: hypothetical protein PKM65_00525 [Spirochaetota bacterium]|nr:hypothetical protein [Spirochaetota bacterium]HNT11698.1 hypothetical protein [Spirochaetota bacterium]